MVTFFRPACLSIRNALALTQRPHLHWRTVIFVCTLLFRMMAVVGYWNTRNIGEPVPVVV